MDLKQKFFAFVFFVNILFSLTFCAADSEAEKYPFIKIGSKYYLINTATKMWWFEAVHYCRTQRGDLVNIQSKAEMDALSSHLTSNEHSDKRFWTSGNDITEEGTYKSISDGQPLAYVKWGPMEPNNMDNEDCIEIINKNNIFHMNDFKCVTELFVICELSNDTNKKEEVCEVAPPSCALEKLKEVCKSMAIIANCRD